MSLDRASVPPGNLGRFSLWPGISLVLLTESDSLHARVQKIEQVCMDNLCALKLA